MNFAFREGAARDLSRMSRDDAERIKEKIRWFCANFYSLNARSLSGEFSRYFRLRVGDWRILYEIDYSRTLIIIHVVGHRSKIYRKQNLTA